MKLKFDFSFSPRNFHNNAQFTPDFDDHIHSLCQTCNGFAQMQLIWAATVREDEKIAPNENMLMYECCSSVCLCSSNAVIIVSHLKSPAVPRRSNFHLWGMASRNVWASARSHGRAPPCGIITPRAYRVDAHHTADLGATKFFLPDAVRVSGCRCRPVSTRESTALRTRCPAHVRASEEPTAAPPSSTPRDRLRPVRLCGTTAGVPASVLTL